MTSGEDIAMHESPVSDRGRHDVEQDAISQSPTELTQFESRKKKVSVLIGCSILQLPIWGMAIAISFQGSTSNKNTTQALPCPMASSKSSTITIGLSLATGTSPA